MITSTIKLAAIIVVVFLLIGGAIFGKDLASYMRSSAKGVQQTVKQNVPLEFELRRARDLLDQIIPEMHANIRLIAQEEVEVETLKTSITTHDQQVQDERKRIGQLRDALAQQNPSYRMGKQTYTRQQLTENLANRFDRFKEAEVLLTSKHRLLDNRENSLKAAMAMLDKTRSQKSLLEEKIQSLHSQYRLVQAAAAGSKFAVNSSKLAQTQKLIDQIEKRLDVAERVLAHETRFVQSFEMDTETVSEQDLFTEIDDYFNPAPVPEPSVSQDVIPEITPDAQPAPAVIPVN